MVPHLILGVPDWFSLAWPDSMHDICCTILQGECIRIKIRGKWHFRRAVCLHNPEHVHSDSRGSTGGNAENAQHVQNAPHGVQRHSHRQHAAHVAQGSVCVFFLGGGGLSLNSPTTQQSAAEGGGGFQPRFPDHRAIGNRCGIFFCGTPPVRLCWAQTRHYMSDRHQSGAC